MVNIKQKRCKGTGKSLGFGCGEPYTPTSSLHKGLCNICYPKWLYTTSEGLKVVDKSTLKAKKQVLSIERKETAEKKKQFRRPNKKREFYSSMAWVYCSRYVLLYYADSDGIVECCTSGLKYHLPNKNIQAGHLHKATEHYNTAFEFKNICPQSYRDNKYFSGRPEIMKKWIEKTHGPGTLEYLNQKKNIIYKLDAAEFEIWKAHYKKLFDDLVKEKGFNPWKK